MTLKAAQIEQFKAEGYLVVRGGLKDGDLDPVIREFRGPHRQKSAGAEVRGQDLLAA